MTYPDPDPRIAQPIPVNIQNWDSRPIKQPLVRKSTLRTYLLDPTGTVGPAYVQISDYEPNRLRLMILVTDAAVALTTWVPTKYPDASSVTAVNQGFYLPVSDTEKDFYGADAFWLVNLGTVGRVSVLKEYSA